MRLRKRTRALVNDRPWRLVPTRGWQWAASQLGVRKPLRVCPFAQSAPLHRRLFSVQKCGNVTRHMARHAKFLTLVEKLIDDSQAITTVYSGGRSKGVPIGFARWRTDIALFKQIGGAMIAPWIYEFEDDGDPVWRVETGLAALETIKFAIDNGLLSSFEDLVLADTFSDLMDQGKYLLGQGYSLAAGVIFRAGRGSSDDQRLQYVAL